MTRQRGAFGYGPHLCPADVRVDAVAVPTIGAGDDILAPHDPGVGQDTIRDQFGRLYGRRLVGDDPRNVDLALGQLDDGDEEALVLRQGRSPVDRLTDRVRLLSDT